MSFQEDAKRSIAQIKSDASLLTRERDPLALRRIQFEADQLERFCARLDVQKLKSALYLLDSLVFALENLARKQPGLPVPIREDVRVAQIADLRDVEKLISEATGLPVSRRGNPR